MLAACGSSGEYRGGLTVGSVSGRRKVPSRRPTCRPGSYAEYMWLGCICYVAIMGRGQMSFAAGACSAKYSPQPSHPSSLCTLHLPVIHQCHHCQSAINNHVLACSSEDENSRRLTFPLLSPLTTKGLKVRVSTRVLPISVHFLILPQDWTISTQTERVLTSPRWRLG